MKSEDSQLSFELSDYVNFLGIEGAFIPILPMQNTIFGFRMLEENTNFLDKVFSIILFWLIHFQPYHDDEDEVNKKRKMELIG